MNAKGIGNEELRIEKGELRRGWNWRWDDESQIG